MDKVIVTIIGIILIVSIYWFFLGPKDGADHEKHDHH